VIAHLENSDVTKLLRHYQYNLRCDADNEVAWLQAENRAAEERKAETQQGDDEMAGECGGCAGRVCCADGLLSLLPCTLVAS
jgi:hypothetical protein